MRDEVFQYIYIYIYISAQQTNELLSRDKNCIKLGKIIPCVYLSAVR